MSGDGTTEPPGDVHHDDVGEEGVVEPDQGVPSLEHRAQRRFAAAAIDDPADGDPARQVDRGLREEAAVDGHQQGTPVGELGGDVGQEGRARRPQRWGGLVPHGAVGVEVEGVDRGVAPDLLLLGGEGHGPEGRQGLDPPGPEPLRPGQCPGSFGGERVQWSTSPVLPAGGAPSCGGAGANVGREP